MKTKEDLKAFLVELADLMKKHDAAITVDTIQLPDPDSSFDVPLFCFDSEQPLHVCIEASTNEPWLEHEDVRNLEVRVD